MPSDFIAKPPYNVVQPGAYSAVDASLVSGPNLLAGHPIPMVLGTALGGQPDTPIYFRSPQQLLQVLKGGPGYDVARFVFDGGASQVGFIRVGNSPTQGTLTLAGTGNCVTLTSLDWGSWVNSIQITVATGPIITLTYTDAYGVTYTETWNLTGVASLTNAKIAQAINGQLYGYNASNYVTAVAGAGTLPLTNISNSPLTAGSDGLSPAAADWTAGLTAAQTEQIDFVTVATSDSTVHAQVLAHCQAMSTPGARHERRMVVGGALGDSVSATIARIAALASARCELVYPGMWDYSSAGVLTEYDSFYTAGKVLGMWCGQPDVATSLLHNYAPIVNVEVALSTVPGGPVDQLLQGNVTPITKAPGGGFWIVDALSGYNAVDETFRDFVVVNSVDYCAQYARQQLESAFVGSKILAGSQNAIRAAATKVGGDLVAQQIVQAAGTPVVDPGPIPDSWSVGLPLQPIGTTKFIFITVQLQPATVTTGSASSLG